MKHHRFFSLRNTNTQMYTMDHRYFTLIGDADVIAVFLSELRKYSYSKSGDRITACITIAQHTHTFVVDVPADTDIKCAGCLLICVVDPICLDTEDLLSWYSATQRIVLVSDRLTNDAMIPQWCEELQPGLSGVRGIGPAQFLTTMGSLITETPLMPSQLIDPRAIPPPPAVPRVCVCESCKPAEPPAPAPCVCVCESCKHANSPVPPRACADDEDSDSDSLSDTPVWWL